MPYLFWESNSGGFWQPYGLLPNPNGIGFSTAATGIGNGNNLQVIGVGSSDKLPYLIWQSSTDASWHWYGQLPDPNGVQFTEVAAGVADDGHLQVILIGTDGLPYLIYQASGIWHWYGQLPTA